jgi:hypothetical protein
MTVPTPFPWRGEVARMNALRATLRLLDTLDTPVQDLVAACLEAVPNALIDEIAQALSQVAAEQMAGTKSSAQT